ncbi:HTTM domain-containing protein [Corynebacterium hindlerae]|nr:HTTM domain-containing protein [Corynebacterium hindlerae]
MQLSNLITTLEHTKLYPSHGMAMVRIGFGIAILLSIVPDIPAWNSVWGAERSFLPASATPSSVSYDWHSLLLVGACTLTALTMSLGFLTRLSTLGTLITYRSLCNSNPLLTDGGDNLLHIALIFLIFTNASDVWSFDARFHLRPPFSLSTQSWYLPIANCAWMLFVFQVCVVYTIAGLAKVAGDTWLAGEGVSRSLTSIQFQNLPWLSNFMLSFEWVLIPASFLTVFMQIYFPFLVLNKWSRIPTLIMFFLFHASIGIVMGLVSFAIVMISAEMAFVRDSSVLRARKFPHSRHVETQKVKSTRPEKHLSRVGCVGIFRNEIAS